MGERDNSNWWIFGIMVPLMIIAVALLPKEARAQQAFPDQILVPMEIGGPAVDTYVTFTPSKSVGKVVLRAPYRIISGRLANMEVKADPVAYDRLLKAAATRCVREIRMVSPSLLGIDTDYNRLHQPARVVDSNIWYENYTMSRDVARNKRDLIENACRTLLSFGNRQLGWDAFPESVLVPMPGTTTVDMLVPGFVAAKDPFFDKEGKLIPSEKIFIDNDYYCMDIAQKVQRTRGRTPGSDSSDHVVLIYAPELYLQGYRIIPSEAAIGFLDEEVDRCEDYRSKRKQMGW